jgi:hypothetical protein
MKTALFSFALLLCATLASAQNADDSLAGSKWPTPTKFCTAMAAAHSIQSTMGEEEARLTARDYSIVALSRDRIDAVVLGCIANPEVPEKVKQAWAKALAERIRLRYRLDLAEAVR